MRKRIDHEVKMETKIDGEKREPEIAEQSELAAVDKELCADCQLC